MVWKVFAPQYMLGVIELLCVDFAVMVGLWLGVGRIVRRITRVFELPASSSGGSTDGQQSEKMVEYRGFVSL